MKKQFLLFVCISVVGLIFMLLFFVQKNEYRSERLEYPGRGVYDLSKYSPCNLSGIAFEKNRINLDFSTNSTEIEITNFGGEDIVIYLFDIENPTNKYIGKMDLAPSASGRFTMLSGSCKYSIELETSCGNYSILISD